MPKPLKVAFTCHRIGPYHFAQYRATGLRCNATVIEASGKDNKNAWAPVAGAQNFERITLYPDTDSRSHPGPEVARKAGEALDRCRPDAVITAGYLEAYDLGGLRWCVRNNVPRVILYDGTAWDRPRRLVREFIKRRVVSLYSAGFAAGTSAKDYLGILGLPAERIVTGSFVVDNEHFRRGAEAARKDAGNIRLRHGLPPRYFFLAARFLPFKNIPHALQAFARYRELARGGTPESLWSLVIAGDGPDKSEIMRLIAELNLGASVHHVGYKFYDELPTFYALAGAFVLPSLIEPWGLVVNEAMASGLPVLVSRRCGCAADLVRDGVNGYLLNPLEIEEMAQCFLRIADPKTDLATMGQASREIIQARDLETYAAGAMRAVDLAIRAPRRKATLVDTFILRNLPRKKSVVC